MSARTSLASLEAKRNAKRRQVESLFEQQQAIQKQMDALQEELQALDDEIDALEYGDDDYFQEKENIQRDEEEELTEAAAATMTFPEELLSDPTTQMTQQQQQQQYDAAAIPAQRPRSSTGGGGNMLMGQLELSRTSVSKKKHAAPPAGLKRTGESSSQTNTLENYFANNNGSSHRQQPSHAATAMIPSNNDNVNLSAQIRDLLNNTFRIQAFRGHQEEIIHSTLVGQDCFVIMRTGGGKSLTYQLPALLEGRYSRERKITLVVSPLLSLIQDQENQLNDYCRGSAISFHSQLSREEQTRRWGLLRDYNSGVCLVLVTPEKVHKSNKLRNELQKLHEQGRLGRFVIDEAHCCSNWGHDFRPDYTRLGLLKTHFPTIPLLAVTATASDRVRNDVCSILRLGTDYQFFRSTARRPNLTYSVKPKNGTKIVNDMTHFIQQYHPNNAGIIYTMTRKEADDLADKLCERGIVARSYHSSVSATNKERIHKSWMRNETQVVVATIAFGLGINKPDVRFVLHQTISKSLEAYYQESGRAGRDGGPADCVLYYSPKDVARLICMIHGDNGEHTFWNMARYAQASGSDAVCKGIILKSMGEPDAPDVEPLMEADDGVVTELKDVTAHAKTVMTLLQQKILDGHDLTLPMLVKEWRSKKDPVDWYEAM